MDSLVVGGFHGSVGQPTLYSFYANPVGMARGK
jgi:hypothetical protein